MTSGTMQRALSSGTGIRRLSTTHHTGLKIEPIFNLNSQHSFQNRAQISPMARHRVSMVLALCLLSSSLSFEKCGLVALTLIALALISTKPSRSGDFIVRSAWNENAGAKVHQVPAQKCTSSAPRKIVHSPGPPCVFEPTIENAIDNPQSFPNRYLIWWMSEQTILRKQVEQVYVFFLHFMAANLLSCSSFYRNISRSYST